jgi:hypothetical protein
VGLRGVKSHHVVGRVFVDLADGRRPVLLAVDLGQHLGREFVRRAVVDDLAKAQADDPFGEPLRKLTSWMLMIAESLRSPHRSRISYMIFR